MSNNFNFTESGYISSNDFNFESPISAYNILAGTSSDFVAIWADPTANIETAKVYISTTGEGAAFSVVNLNQKTLVDSYMIDKEGSFGESLEGENVVDINVSKTGA